MPGRLLEAVRPFHLLVTAAWDAERPGQHSIRLESTFVLRRDTEGLRILVYLNHHDVAALLGDVARYEHA